MTSTYAINARSATSEIKGTFCDQTSRSDGIESVIKMTRAHLLRQMSIFLETNQNNDNSLYSIDIKYISCSKILIDELTIQMTTGDLLLGDSIDCLGYFKPCQLYLSEDS